MSKFVLAVDVVRLLLFVEPCGIRFVDIRGNTANHCRFLYAVIIPACNLQPSVVVSMSTISPCHQLLILAGSHVRRPSQLVNVVRARESLGKE